MTNLRSVHALGPLSLVGLFVFACSSPADAPESQAQCASLINGTWSGDVLGETLVVSLAKVVPPFDCEFFSAGFPIESSWTFRGETGSGPGRLTFLSDGASVDVDLLPTTGWCPVYAGQAGAAITLVGRVVGDTIRGSLRGGWRVESAPGACAESSDTVISLPRTRVELYRGS